MPEIGSFKMEKTKNAFSRADSIIAEVRLAEKKADELLDKARKEAEKIITDAKLQASRMQQEDADSLLKQREAKIAELMDKFKEEKKEDTQAIKKQIDSLESRGAKNNEKASAHLLSALEEIIHG